MLILITLSARENQKLSTLFSKGFAVSLARDSLLWLYSTLASNAINKF